MKGAEIGEVRPCSLCGIVRRKRELWWCSLCRKWFCVGCGRDDHWWQCPKNPERSAGGAGAKGR